MIQIIAVLALIIAVVALLISIVALVRSGNKCEHNPPQPCCNSVTHVNNVETRHDNVDTEIRRVSEIMHDHQLLELLAESPTIHHYVSTSPQLINKLIADERLISRLADQKCVIDALARHASLAEAVGRSRHLSKSLIDMGVDKHILKSHELIETLSTSQALACLVAQHEQLIQDVASSQILRSSVLTQLISDTDVLMREMRRLMEEMGIQSKDGQLLLKHVHVLGDLNVHEDLTAMRMSASSLIVDNLKTCISSEMNVLTVNNINMIEDMK